MSPMSNESELQADLADAVNTLDKALAVLDARLRAESGYAQWVWGQEQQYQDKKRTPQQRYNNARDKARAVIRTIDYVDGQTKRETRICPALLGASKNTLAAARSVNQAKAEVEAALAPMRDVMVLDKNMETGNLVKVSLQKVALRMLKHPRFHFQQATRQLVVLDLAPESATFVWTVCPRISSITKEQVVKRIESKLRHDIQNPALLADLKKAKQLKDDERLAVVRPPHIHPRVNLVFKDGGQYVNEQYRG